MKTFILVATMIAITPVFAGELTDAEPNHFSWEENNVNGPVFERTPQGWRIYTHVTQPVRVADRRGIENAKIVAEERAKGIMVSYMHEHSTNFRAHVQSDIEKSRTTSGADGQPTSDAVTRDALDSLTQIQTSFASGDLYGVTVLGQDYDETKREVTVIVGMSSKSADQAREMRRAMTEAGSDDAALPKPPIPAARPSVASRAPGSETRRLKSDNW